MSLFQGGLPLGPDFIVFGKQAQEESRNSNIEHVPENKGILTSIVTGMIWGLRWKVGAKRGEGSWDACG